MEAKMLEGRPIAAEIKQEVIDDVGVFRKKHGFVPTLAVVLVGEDPASQIYVKRIVKSFEEAGMGCQVKSMPSETTPAELQGLIRQLNDASDISGIIVQMPLPPQLAQEMVTQVLSPAKDVDGIHPENAGRLLLGLEGFVPNTPEGGMEILRRYGVPMKGKQAVIVGRSNIVGKPMAILLLAESATVTICHSHTANLGEVTRQADILVAAIGRAKTITGEMIKPGATVIDFGINYLDGKMVGDVDLEEAKQVAGAITPVPGGTGPVTNVMLLRNTLRAARRLACR
jgi:methylenetetrahydrofolate dehydrogenase (NADP+)/methenyltetrahydrofolate cyclohydrolase